MSDSLAAEAADADVLPCGTVSLLFTDIEGSTEHLRTLRGAYGRMLADHSRVLRDACASHGGRQVDTQGDAFFYVFQSAIGAVRAAIDLQRATARHQWPMGATLRVRVGVHTGEAELIDRRYVGLDVHRAARICSLAHGGQVLLSQSCAALIADSLPAGVTIRELGGVNLKGFDQPELLAQLDIDDLHDSFPAPRGAQSLGDASAAAIADAGPDVAGVEFELLILGPVAVRRAQREIRVTAAKHRMILAELGLRVGEVVSTDVLIDTLWGDHPPPTATKALQVYISELRKLVEVDSRQPRVITSVAPGYRLSLARESVDLPRFERLWSAGREALAGADPSRARGLLREALGLWRGDPLADFRFEDAFAADIRRLEELRIGCLEDRFDADLALGDHARLVPEIEALVHDRPLRERLRGQLMLALYRCGRQTDALAAYQSARDQLVNEFGIDPSPPLVALERQILQQDPALAAPLATAMPAVGALRSMLVVSQSSEDVEALTALARTITVSDDAREFVLARVVTGLPDQDPTSRLREVTRALVDRRDQLAENGVRVRVAAFVSDDPAVDLAKLAKHQDADLLLVDGTQTLLTGGFGIIDLLLQTAACDVALHLPREQGERSDPVVVPFGGSEHDWAALELGAVLARGEGRPLVLAGVERTETAADSSRLLATASLIIQRVAGVIAEPVLVRPGAAAVIEMASSGHVVTGLSARFREEGIGETRFHLARDASGPVTFVRRGTRPGVLAPPETITRFTWSLNAR